MGLFPMRMVTPFWIFADGTAFQLAEMSTEHMRVLA
jgi:hypothetical protein